jgi:hypothetical protein
MTRPIRTLALTLAAAFGLLACATLDEATADLRPYGQQLNERIEQWDRWCRSEKLGPYNDNPRRAHIASCDFLFLKDKRWDPNADEFSRYAHSIRLPPPHDQPQAVYRHGMSSRAYFEELCAKEAGEWIFRTVKDVEGVLQARPSAKHPRGSNQLTPFAQEMTYGGSAEDGLWLSMGDAGSPFKYRFFEYPEPSKNGKSHVVRYYRDAEHLKRMEPGAQLQWREYPRFRVPYVDAERSRATYAFVGRGTVRTGLDEQGIYGIEVLVVDVRTKEVLAFRRTFVIVRPAPTSWGRLNKDVVGRGCRNVPTDNYAPRFVVRVLQPPV